MKYYLYLDGKKVEGSFLTIEDGWKWLKSQKGLTEKKRKGRDIRFERIEKRIMGKIDKEIIERKKKEKRQKRNTLDGWV